MKYPNLIEHFEMIMAHVQDESYAEAVATIATFKNRLVELEEKLSEFQNGLPIEKAKTDGTVYNWHDGKSWRYVWYQLDGWTDGTFTKISEDTFFTRQQLNMFRPKIVHPLSAP